MSKKAISNIVKWLIIIGLLTFATIKFKETMVEALDEVRHFSIFIILICLVLSNAYYCCEGMIISQMTKQCDNRLSWWEGVKCSYMCAFYKLTTLGSGTGIAQLAFYKANGIDIPSGTGMGIAQYTFQKITIGIFGVISFIVVIAFGEKELLKYSTFMLLGVLVISAICLFLFIIVVSKKFSDLLMKIGYKLVKPKWKLYAKLADAQEAIDALQYQGRLLWKDKMLFIKVVLLNFAKFACWYILPGIILSQTQGVNIIFCMFLMSVCNMIGCVMLAPSGVGTLDFVFTLFFASMIDKDEIVVATLLAYRFFTWILPFVIGIIPAVTLRDKALEDE